VTRCTHRDGTCIFEVLVEEYHVDDPAVTLMARVIHGADVSEDADATPQSAGLHAIVDGFALLGLDDQRQVELEPPDYDALHAWALAEADRTQRHGMVGNPSSRRAVPPSTVCRPSSPRTSWQ
jgi:hypothetical protein